MVDALIGAGILAFGVLLGAALTFKQNKKEESEKERGPYG